MASQTAAAEPAWLADRRSQAQDALSRLALPSFHGTAGWEFTPIDSLDLDGYELGRAGDPADAQDALAVPAHALRPDASSPAASSDAGTRGGAEQPIVLPLEIAAQTHSDLLERHLGVAVPASTPLIARNDALWSDGWLVYVPANTRVAQPIVLNTVHQPSTTLHHRLLVIVEENAEAELWAQQLSGQADGEGIDSFVSEIFVGPGARLRLLDVQDLSERAWIFGSGRAIVQRDGDLRWTALGFGSANGKVFLETKLAGPGAHAEVTGAYAARGRQHLDFDTLQEHAAESTTSDLAFRGILEGRSSAVWRGMIKVDPGAQRTDAFQESRNLLLSKRAHADAIPGLEILADDVRCTHAAAIAQIDPDQLFYLRSHGLPDEGARRLVIEGFLQALLERFPEGDMRAAVAEALGSRIDLVLGA